MDGTAVALESSSTPQAKASVLSTGTGYIGEPTEAVRLREALPPPRKPLLINHLAAVSLASV
jgi:hypothetical protein